jgi:hypothetical protein
MDFTPSLAVLLVALTPQPQQLELLKGALRFSTAQWELQVPPGPEFDACAQVLTDAFAAAGVRVTLARKGNPLEFRLGKGAELTALPEQGIADQAYVLAVADNGIAARAASAPGLLYAAQTLTQLLRIATPGRPLPCLRVSDYPEFELRGVYVEGGQERFGHIVTADYLCEQIRNLFPYTSFPECADEGTLTEDECRQVTDEARRFHVKLVPSLQTLAQASELFWNSERGEAFREATAPGLACPSNPELYPLIKGLYRDLLTRFDQAPFIGIGCSEIEMQWQERYCPRCRERIEAGETVRDLLLGHAVRCGELVHELARELDRPVRPLMWGDEFYMYGEGRDWVGLDRIDRRMIMGFWKYWGAYDGIAGVMERGYDVFGISAMYNHCFYLADLSPAEPPKSWPSMEETGTLNITEMITAAQAAARAFPEQRFLGVATASFSKHRLRAFDSIWYGFALNGHCTWNGPQQPFDQYRDTFTAAFARHYYDTRTDAVATTMATALERLDTAKSRLEHNNQLLHDVVGVYDTQEAGYQGNSLTGALAECGKLLRDNPEGAAAVRERAQQAETEAADVMADLDAIAPESLGRRAEWANLRVAADKVAAHAEREQILMDTALALSKEDGGGPQPAGLAERWDRHQERLDRILARTEHLWSRGDPTGFLALKRDVAVIRDHVARIGTERTADTDAIDLLTEDFDSLDPQTWIVLGQPEVRDGLLLTRAPGGWENYCGLVTRESFALDPDQPLLVEFAVRPAEMGIDSQLFGAAEEGRLSYRFTFYGPTDRFGVYTRISEEQTSGVWRGTPTGWHLRNSSPPLDPTTTYHVRAVIRSQSFRVVVRTPDAPPASLPFWDSGTIPMDALDATQLLFADVEPEGATAASEWSRIGVSRQTRRQEGK